MHRTIGQTLRAAREARGLALPDVAHKTRIPANRLQQLEDDNFAAFGNMAYAKSFLKHYSRFLDVDASEVADAFPIPPLGGPSDYRYLTETHGPWIERKQRSARKEPLSKTGGSPVPTLAGMFAMFVIAGVLLGNHLVERQKTDGKHAPAAGEQNLGDKAPEAPAPASALQDERKDRMAAPETRAAGLTGVQPEMVIRPAVLPKNIPARDTPNTPVRRPEIVN